LPNIIKEVTEKYGLEEGDLTKSRLKGRFRRNRSKFANGRGVNSPMFRVEKILVGSDPFILLDGHGSRFELPFVEYIHGDKEWTVCIGVPYGTSLWQVGDSKQQNCQYKDKSKEGKERIVTMKTKHGLRFTIIKQDIMWIFCYALEKSFARVDTNKYAIAERGWGPLNYVLLDHMVNLRDDSDRYFPQESLTNLNTTEGVAGDTIDLFMEEKTRREELQGVYRATRDRHQRETAQKKLDMGKRLTVGVWAATGNHCIDTECMEILHRQREKQKQK
jgi:hypothetical protein